MVKINRELRTVRWRSQGHEMEKEMEEQRTREESQPPARELWLCSPEQLKDFLGANPSCSLSPSRKNGSRLLCLQRALVLFPIKRVDTKSDFHSALSYIFSL